MTIANYESEAEKRLTDLQQRFTEPALKPAANPQPLRLIQVLGLISLIKIIQNRSIYMNKRTSHALTAIIRAGLFALLLAGTAFAQSGEEAAVKETIQKGYIEGVHMHRDADAIRKGFHDKFVMATVSRDGSVRHITRDQWIGFLTPQPGSNRQVPQVDWEAPSVQIAGNAAAVRVEVYINKRHVYTDFLNLYKFEDGWKIVAKTFYSHPKAS